MARRAHELQKWQRRYAPATTAEDLEGCWLRDEPNSDLMVAEIEGQRALLTILARFAPPSLSEWFWPRATYRAG